MKFLNVVLFLSVVVPFASANASTLGAVKFSEYGSSKIESSVTQKKMERDSIMKENYSRLLDALDQSLVKETFTRFYKDVYGSIYVRIEESELAKTDASRFVSTMYYMGDVSAPEECAIHLAKSVKEISEEISVCVEKGRTDSLR